MSKPTIVHLRRKKERAKPRPNRKIRAADQITKDVFFAICKRINTPYSLGAWLRFRDDQTELSGLSINPRDYLDPVTFRNDYFVCEYLSKYKGLATRFDRREAARTAFENAEVQCKEANERISLYRLGRFLPFPDVERVISLAQRKIRRMLTDDVPYAKVLDGCRWGSGSTFSLKGVEACIDNKLLESQLTVTRSAARFLRAAMSTDLHWLQARGIPAEGPCSPLNDSFQLVRGCRLWFVPKNAKTDRSIAIEPTGNILLQLGVGAYFRKLLLRAGVDLDDQSINQRLAQRALFEDLATVDLKAASDTICRELVFMLLPPRWSFFLDELRSRELLDNEWRPLQKFSSMGNGFTFELESLIFWALSESIIHVLGVPKVLGVYGDDIILPTSCVPLLKRVFNFVGFTINAKKTHFDSLFRESCGKHYFAGVDVTPMYQKEVPSTLSELYRFANRLRRYSCRNDDGYDDASPYKAAWRRAVRSLPRNKWGGFLHVVPLQCQGKILDFEDYLLRHTWSLDESVIEDDDGLALSESELLLYRDARGRLPVLTFRSSKREADHAALLAYALRFGTAEPLRGEVTLRRRGTFSSRRRYYPVGRQFADWV